MASRKRKNLLMVAPADGSDSSASSAPSSPQASASEVSTRTNWTRTMLLTLLSAILAYVKEHGMPHSTAKKKKTASTPTKKQKATEAGWDAIGKQITPAVPGAACQKKYEAVSGEGLLGPTKKALSELQSTYPSIAETYMTQTKPEVTGAARSAAITELVDKWTSQIIVASGRPCRVVVPVELAKEVPDLMQGKTQIERSYNVNGVSIEEITSYVDKIRQEHSTWQQKSGSIDLPSSDDSDTDEDSVIDAGVGRAPSTTTSTKTHAPSAKASAAERRQATAKAQTAQHRQQEHEAFVSAATALGGIAAAQTRDITQRWTTPVDFYNFWHLSQQVREALSLYGIEHTVQLSTLTCASLVGMGIPEPQARAMLFSLEPYFGPRV